MGHLIESVDQYVSSGLPTPPMPPTPGTGSLRVPIGQRLPGTPRD